MYLSTEGRLPTYQPFTTDADLVIVPAQLVPKVGRRGARPPETTARPPKHFLSFTRPWQGCARRTAKPETVRERAKGLQPDMSDKPARSDQ